MPLPTPRPPPTPPHSRTEGKGICTLWKSTCKSKHNRLQHSRKPSNGSFLNTELNCKHSLYLAPPHCLLLSQNQSLAFLIPSRSRDTSAGISQGRRGHPAWLLPWQNAAPRQTARFAFFQVVWEPIRLLECWGTLCSCRGLWHLAGGAGSWPSPQHPLLSNALLCSQLGSSSVWHCTLSPMKHYLLSASSLERLRRLEGFGVKKKIKIGKHLDESALWFLWGQTSASWEGSSAKAELFLSPICVLVMPRSSVLGPQHSIARPCTNNGAVFPPGHSHTLGLSAVCVASCLGASHFLLQPPPTHIITAYFGALSWDASELISLDFLPPISSLLLYWRSFALIW